MSRFEKIARVAVAAIVAAAFVALAWPLMFGLP